MGRYRSAIPEYVLVTDRKASEVFSQRFSAAKFSWLLYSKIQNTKLSKLGILNLYKKTFDTCDLRTRGSLFLDIGRGKVLRYRFTVFNNICRYFTKFPEFFHFPMFCGIPRTFLSFPESGNPAINYLSIACRERWGSVRVWLVCLFLKPYYYAKIDATIVK
jgi:hypothetical protein